MIPDGSKRPDPEISEFAEILEPGPGREPPVIVGGHAVGLWSRYFLNKGFDELAEFLPFTSKDLDLVGTISLLEEMQGRFHGTILRSEPRSPVFGRLELPRKGGGTLKIEVLHTVMGLSAGDLADGRTEELGFGQDRPVHGIPVAAGTAATVNARSPWRRRFVTVPRSRSRMLRKRPAAGSHSHC